MHGMPLVAYTIWTAAAQELKARKARALGAFEPCIWNTVDRLPFTWSSYPDFVRYSRRGWKYTEKYEAYARLGQVWALVTPVTMYLHVADSDAIGEVFARRGEFVRPLKEYKLLEIYGPCISTVGDEWSRHRKVVAAPFNESIMEFVWEESLRQARNMLRCWVSASESGIRSVKKDTRTLSLNVLASAAFRKSYEFRGSAEPAINNEATSYRDSLQIVLDNIILLLVIPFSLLTSHIVPKRWGKVGKATVSFKEHMRRMLDRETEALTKGVPGSGGIMTSFARALRVHNQEAKDPEQKNSDNVKKGLSVEEIFGNVFVINFAGHDTTAVTFAFSMLLLAAYPSVQEWIAEEIREVTKDIPIEEWDYKVLFPVLKRCRAVMFETLRIYPPIPALPRVASRVTQTVPVGDRTLVIPPGVNTTIPLKAVQSSPGYWPDPETWKPSRWISQTTSDSIISNERGLSEELLPPKPGTYFPWSDGPQKCPGKKFSEVEAVAVLACIFQQHRLLIQKRAGESDEAAQKRVLACTHEITVLALLKMTNSDKVCLICKKV
ncbi:cytochrome P450 [Xylaria venustula]|nr:cytochrome P450 [Xylaria venustula]